MGKKALKRVDSGLTAEEQAEHRQLIQRMHTSAIRKAAERLGDSPQTQEQAEEQLRQIQERTKRRIEEQGGTVDEVERLILAEDE